MNNVHDFIVLEYSLVISIIGTIIGLVLAIVGVVCDKKRTTTIVGIVLLVFFLIVCGVLIVIRYSSGSSDDNGTPSFSEGTNNGSTNTSGVSPKPTAVPQSTATTKPVEVSPAPTATPNATPQQDNTATSAPAVVTDNELTLDVAPIEVSLYNVAPIDSLDYSILPAEIKIFSGDISSSQQVDNHFYVPEIDGTYRFEFSDVPSGTYFNLYVFNSGNERINYGMDLDNGDGITVSLEAGQSYNIRVEQYKNMGAYTLNVGPQKPVVDVSLLTAVNDSIQYTEQENNYLFMAPRDGLYRFEFSNVPDGTDLSLYVYNSGWERINYSQDLDNGDGISVELSAEKTYFIKTVQYRSVGNYVLNIGQKKEIVDISAYTAVADSIQYTNQENDYAFTPSVSGTYRFEFSDVPDGTDLSLYVYNSGWERINYSQDLDNGDGISVELSAEKTYFIKTVQYRSVGNYVLNIGHKKEIVDISAYTAVTDSIQYTSQENDYAFTPSVSGTYWFEFSEVPDGTDLSLYVYNSGWERINYSQDLDNGDGISVELSAGKTYYIRVSQYRKYGTYRLGIFEQ